MPPQLPADPIPCIGYIRVSVGREEMISPDIQRRAITDWARRMNRRITRWIEDLDKSGRNFKRDVIQAIELIEAGEAREIAMYRYDRWGRNSVESLANIARVERAGGRVQSTTEPLDPETAIGKYSRVNALGLAEMQSNIIGENWAAAHANRVSRGLPATGGRRYGYRRLGRVPHPTNPQMTMLDLSDPQGERYVPDVEDGTAEILVDLYRRYAGGEGSTELIGWLNGHGYLNAYGNAWSHQGFFKTMDSGFAAGLLRIHDPECRGCPSPMRCRNRVYVQGAQEPIIGPTLWEAYLARRKEAGLQAPRARTPKYPLTGLLRCGHCYKALTHAYDRDGPGEQLRCSTYTSFGLCRGLFVKRWRAEEAVRERLAEWAADIDPQAAATRARQKARAAAQADTERLDGELTKLDKALARLATQRAMDEDMPDSVYEQARNELLARRAELEAAKEKAAAVPPAAEDFGPIIAGVLEEWDILAPARKRALLSRLIRHVTIRRPVPGGPAEIVVTPVWDECLAPCCAAA